MPTSVPQPADYAKLLADIKARIQAAQTRAVFAVNTEMMRLYWGIGRLLDERQGREGWGAAVIPRLARDLRHELPEVKGFSARNLDRMLAFARAYRSRGSFRHRLWRKRWAPRLRHSLWRNPPRTACCGNCPGAITRCCWRRSSRSMSAAGTSRRRWPTVGAGRRRCRCSKAGPFRGRELETGLALRRRLGP